MSTCLWTTGNTGHILFGPSSLGKPLCEQEQVLITNFSTPCPQLFVNKPLAQSRGLCCPPQLGEPLRALPCSLQNLLGPFPRPPFPVPAAVPGSGNWERCPGPLGALPGAWSIAGPVQPLAPGSALLLAPQRSKNCT